MSNLQRKILGWFLLSIPATALVGGIYLLVGAGYTLSLIVGFGIICLLGFCIDKGLDMIGDNYYPRKHAKGYGLKRAEEADKDNERIFRSWEEQEKRRAEILDRWRHNK